MAGIENWRLENLPGVSWRGLKISRNETFEVRISLEELRFLLVVQRDVSYWNVGEICCDGYWISKLATRANHKGGIFFYGSSLYVAI